MPSCVPGFEYDIFVSYRQKDNRYDGWVTSFVEHLRRELEVTMKEQVSVYFDENVHDGVLETHEVEATLNQKLKCIIFIPIISQTYCDPSCYAWQHEFLVFKKNVFSDAFGLKVQLANGNVASRILPIRIHELDNHDATLLANELGGPIRSIDFIFKSPGVNRPLLAQEDHPNQNQLKISYRDQVNKVANQVKEIISALKESKSKPRNKTTEENRKSSVLPRWKKSLTVFLVLAAIMLLSVVLFNFFSKSNSRQANPKAAIAVLPFKLIGQDEESVYLADGIQEAIRISLSHFPEFRVKSRTSVEQYRNIGKSILEISQELNVGYLLEGSAQKINDYVRVMVQLVDVQADVIWSKQFDAKVEDVFALQSEISKSIAESLQATITPEIAGQIKAPTNIEAYDLFIKGKQASRQFLADGNIESLDLTIRLLKQATQKDPDFATCYGWLAGLYLIKNAGNIADAQDSVVMMANKALALDSSVVEASLALSELYYAQNDDVNALRYTYLALTREAVDSSMTTSLVDRLSSIYLRIGSTEQALYLLDVLLKPNPRLETFLYKKIFVLSANHNVSELTELRNEVPGDQSSNGLLALIDFHLALEKKSYSDLRVVYQNIVTPSGVKENFTQYSAIIAYSLRQQGMKEEAKSIIRTMEEGLGDELFYRAQIEIFNGDTNRALQHLKGESVGWYNLSLCDLNPLFAHIRQAPEFKSFIDRNKTRMENIRERIYELEQRSLLPKPYAILEEWLE